MKTGSIKPILHANRSRNACQYFYRSHLSDEVHALRSWRIETFPPNGKVKAGASPAANVGVCETLVEVKTGTGANDLIQYRKSARDVGRDASRLTSASKRTDGYTSAQYGSFVMELTIDGRGDGYRSRAPGIRMAEEVAELFQAS